MNKLYFLFLIIFIAFLNCDGRDRVYKTNAEVLTEHKLLDSFSESLVYFPEGYNEIETDTILGNGFEVKIRSFIDMESHVLQESKTDSITYKFHYRNKKSQIVVKNNGVIFDKLIDKSFVLNFDKSLSDFLKVAVIDVVWMNEDVSLTDTNVTITIGLCKPNTDWCKFFNLVIERDGTYALSNVTKQIEAEFY